MAFNRFVLPFLLGLLVAGDHLSWSDEHSGDKPNILLLLVDDLAWSDLKCYGHPWHQTPNMDQLAASGMRFTHGYAGAPICSASRATVMTGKTTARLGFEFVTKEKPGRQKIDMPVPLRAPPFTLDLPLAEETIAERLAALGYHTAFFGKWHLNAHHGGYLGWSPTHGPRQQGFALAVEDFGMHPYAWKRHPPEEISETGRFPTDSMIHSVCRYLETPRSQPYFAMVSSFYVHTPVKTPCTWLVQKYDKTIPPEVIHREKRVVYAAFVETLDHHIGQILKSLEQSGQREKTLVVLTSDNGGHPEYAANGPLRGSKWNLYEGGVRVPLIASWPHQIEPKSESDVPFIGYDLLPTFVDLAGGTTSGVDGISLRTALTGEKESRAGLGKDRELIWHFPYYHPERGYTKAIESIGVNDFRVSKTRPQSAIRRKNYKLLHFAEDDHVELYDLANDPSEQRDLHLEKPETAQRMLERLRVALKTSGARYAVKAESLP